MVAYAIASTGILDISIAALYSVLSYLFLPSYYLYDEGILTIAPQEIPRTIQRRTVQACSGSWSGLDEEGPPSRMDSGASGCQRRDKPPLYGLWSWPSPSSSRCLLHKCQPCGDVLNIVSIFAPLCCNKQYPNFRQILLHYKGFDGWQWLFFFFFSGHLFLAMMH